MRGMQQWVTGHLSRLGRAGPRRPALSVVVVVHDMPRAASRTLHSLSAAYQRDIPAHAYEVVVVDNGSRVAWRDADVRRFGRNFHLLRIERAARSPAQAINRGAALARAPRLCLMVDGARIVTPRLLATMLEAGRCAREVVVAVPGWHLGPAPQWQSLREGYCEEREDALLAEADWMSDGYRLFDIAVPGASSADAPLGQIAECNSLGLSRALFLRLRGMDERFDQPGGGYVNLDLYRRALTASGVHGVMLAGEASFHQLHGGITTNAAAEIRQGYDAIARARYRQLRGVDFSPPETVMTLHGRIASNALPPLGDSVQTALARRTRAAPIVSMLFCIDAEPDEFMPQRGQPGDWTSCERLLRDVDDIRRGLTRASGRDAHLNWFLRADPQLALSDGDAAVGLRRFASDWMRMAELGDALGVHPHGQRWSDALQAWRCPSDDAAWAIHCLDTAVTAFRDVLGRTPAALRFGNRFMSLSLLRHAARCGIGFDLTTEPGYPGRTGADAMGEVGPCPDYRAWPRSPYRPGPDDLSRPGLPGQGLAWVVPMASVPVDGAPDTRRYETVMLRLPPPQFRRALDAALDRKEASHFAFVGRCDMFGSEAARANLAQLRDHPQAHRFAFETPERMLQRLGLARG